MYHCLYCENPELGFPVTGLGYKNVIPVLINWMLSKKWRSW